MAWVIGGKHFGQYTYDHWFDNDLIIQGGTIMQKEVITFLANYNKSVNETMNGIIKTLSKEEWEKPLGGFYPSVRSLCSHIYICDYNWLLRFKNIRSFKVLDNPFFGDSYSYQKTLFEDMGEYLAKRPDLDSRMIAFADELTAADMGSVLKYIDGKGNSYERNFGGCLLHFLNHETHHRGMISLFLEMLGRENDFCSLSQFVK
jgi:uncharacterized damage-inducible protein DinB